MIFDQRIDLVSPQIIELGIAIAKEINKVEATSYMRGFLIPLETIDRVLQQSIENRRQGRSLPDAKIFTKPSVGN